jgi:hypothetical protein
MDCATAQARLKRGDESQEVLAHMATCVVCRSRGEATEFVRTPEARARAAKMAARGGRSPVAAMLPWIIGGVAVVVIAGAGGLLLWRAGSRGPIAIVTAAPPVTEPAAAAKAEEEPAPAPKEEAPPEPKKRGKRARAAAAPRADEEAPAADDDVTAGMPANGYLSVFSTPWARLILDGKDTGRSTPIVRMTVPAGKHHIELKTRAGTSVEADAVVSKGKEARVVRTIEE